MSSQAAQKLAVHIFKRVMGRKNPNLRFSHLPAPFSAQPEFRAYSYTEPIRFFRYGTQQIARYQHDRYDYAKEQADYLKWLAHKVRREQVRRQRYQFYAGLGKYLGEATLTRHARFWRNAFDRRPSVIQPVKERPGWLQEKVPGFLYYYREGEYSPRYVIPRWSLPLRQELPGGGELPRAPGIPPRWVPWLLRLFPRYSPAPPGSVESTTYNKNCRALFINVYNGQTRWLPCETPFPWKRISPIRQSETYHKPFRKRYYRRRFRNRNAYYDRYRSRRYF